MNRMHPNPAGPARRPATPWTRWLLAGLAALAALVTTGAASAQTPQIAFDSNYTENQQVTNTIRIIGFAITPQSAGYVEIALDGQSLGRAAYPLPRTDVPNSGFIMEIDTLSFINGSHAIKATSYTAAGAVVATVTRTLRFANLVARGALESPGPRNPASAVITFRGWAIANQGFKKLEVLINGLYAGQANWGVSRPDIQAAYPEYGIANAGFTAPVDTDALGLAYGVHRMTLVGVDGTDTRSVIFHAEFQYAKGRGGKNALEAPAQSGIAGATGTLRVTGWTEGDYPATRVDVYLNDRWAGFSTDVMKSRPDIQASVSGVRNLGGFDFTVPALYTGRGAQRIVAVVTDTHGQRANVDVATGPVVFYVADSDRLFGAQLRPSDNYVNSIAMYTTDAGVAPDFVMYFQPWRTAAGACASFNEFPFLPDRVKAAGAIPVITWEPLQDGAGSTQPNFTYAQILAGAQDACLNAYIAQVKAWGSTVLIRFAHEMNGNSNNWTGIANGNDPQGYVAVYRKVVDMFRAAGATNVRFIWSPDHATPPEVPAPSSEIRNYYPGDGYVDFIGVSGYNWGTDPLRGGGWVSAQQIFDNFLSMMVRDVPGKPILITEVGSVPGYGSYVRGDWYKDAMAFFGAHRQVKGIIWFNDYAYASTAFPDFRIANSPNLPAVSPAEIAIMKSLIAAYRGTHDAGLYAIVYEFYAPSLNHYFRTANAEEAAALRANPNLGWNYTNGDFKAFKRDNYGPTAQLVCRFYGSLNPGPNSHFYTADAGECAFLKQLQASTPASQPRWNFEENAFAIDVAAAGACPATAPVAVYRAYNQRAAQNDSNHRYTTSLDTYQTMIAQGWKGEGVVMCASL